MKLVKGKEKHYRVVAKYCDHKGSEVAKWFKVSNNELIKEHADEYFSELRKRFAGMMPHFVFGAESQIFPRYTINDFLVEKGYAEKPKKFVLPAGFNIGGGSSARYQSIWDTWQGEENADNEYFRFLDE